MKRSKDRRSRASFTSQSYRLGQNGVAQLPELTTTATEHHQSEDAQRFLLESSAEFVSRDSETTLKRLAIQAVPFLADFCFFDVLAADGTIQRVSWAHADTVKHELFERGPSSLSQHEAPSTTPSARSCAPANPSLSRKSTMPGCGRSPRASGTSSSCVNLELRSMIAVPLQVTGGTLGVLTFCYSASSGRRYCREDLWVAEDLAHRAALVVENARLYHELQDASRRKDEFIAMLGHECEPARSNPQRHADLPA